MTDPLTPPDCDLRDFAFMPLDATRLLDSDLFALSTGEEFKAALALWCKSWLQVPAASLPDDDRVLAHLSGAGPRWKKVKDMAMRGFVKCSDGRLYHRTVAEKALEAWEKRGAFQERQANKTARQQRWRDRVKEISDELREMGVTPPMNASMASLEGLLRQARDDKETACRRLRRQLGQGQGEYSEANASGADAPPLDPDKVMFDAGVTLICGAGKSEAQARSWLAKARGQHGTEALIAAIGTAKREGAIDPISFMQATLNARAKHAANDWVSPC